MVEGDIHFQMQEIEVKVSNTEQLENKTEGIIYDYFHCDLNGDTAVELNKITACIL